jgi:4-carboxymuconolactone decarboxylase
VIDDGATEPGYAAALDTAARLLGRRLEPFLELGPGEPANGADFARLATVHTFGDSWPRTDVLDTRTRALISVTIAATMGTLEPLRGQLRIALNNGVTPDEIVETFIHIEAYAGAARAFEGYQIAREVFEEVRAAGGSE